MRTVEAQKSSLREAACLGGNKAKPWAESAVGLPGHVQRVVGDMTWEELGVVLADEGAKEGGDEELGLGEAEVREVRKAWSEGRKGMREEDVPQGEVLRENLGRMMREGECSHGE